MKVALILPFALLFNCVNIFATQEDIQKTTGTTVALDEEADRLEKLTRHPDIKPVIDAYRAKEGIEEGVSLSKTQWDEVWESITAEGLHEVVFEALNGKENPDKENHNIELGNFEKKQTKALAALQEYLKTRLEKKLFGDNMSDKTKVKAVNDHGVFHELYKTQMGKNLIVELANYCIHSDPSTGMVPYLSHIDDKRRALFYRELNSSQINQYGTKHLSTSEGGTESRPFERCVGNIGISCDNGSSYPKDKGANAQADTTASSRDKWFPGTKDNENEWKNRDYTKLKMPAPCEISRYMTSVKVTLKELEEYKEEMDQHNSNSNSRFNVATKQEEALDINSVVNISSGELLNGEGNTFREEAQKEAAEAEECFKEGQEACNGSYSIAKADSSQIKDEFNLRNLAMQKKIESELFQDGDTDPDKLKEYLEKKGMDSDNIDTLVQQVMAENKIDEVEAYKKIIVERFESERNDLRRSLNSRLAEKERNEDDSAQAVESKAKTIKSRIEESPEQLAQVFQYANIVSSFLEVKSDGSSSRNTAALVAELEDPFAPSDDSRAPAQAQDFSELEGFAEEESSDSQEKGTSILSSKEIDQIQFSINNSNESGQ